MKNVLHFLTVLIISISTLFSQSHSHSNGNTDQKNIDNNIHQKKYGYKFSSNEKLDEIIKEITPGVNSDSVRSIIQSMQDFGTRWEFGPHNYNSAKWVLDRFKNIGYENAIIDSFWYRETWQYNVIAVYEAKISTKNTIVLGAHHDSGTFDSETDDLALAPGADDNASGVSALLETARLLKEHNFESDVNIRFTTYGVHEDWGIHTDNFSSALHDIEQIKNENLNIILMINHDVLAYTPDPIEESSLGIRFYNGCEKFTELGHISAEKFTILASQSITRNADFTESYAYWKAGINAMTFTTAVLNPHVHLETDVIDHLNMDYCAEIIKASIGTMITIAKIPSDIENFVVDDYKEAGSLFLSWEPNNDTDLSGYRIIVTSEDGSYQKTYETNETEYIVYNLTEGVEYTFGISAFDSEGYESDVIEKKYIPFSFPMDKGILLVDETVGGSGTISSPSEEQVDEFFNNVLSNFTFTAINVDEFESISVNELGYYSSIIWHGNDISNLLMLNNSNKAIKRYLDAGGNFLYAGYLPTKAFSGNLNYPIEFSEGNFLRDYLKIKSADHTFGSKFRGAIGENGYKDIFVDTLKARSNSNFHITKIEGIEASESAKNIFSYITEYDTSTTGGKLAGQSVGVEYLGEDYKVITTSIPLYFMYEEQVKSFLKQVLVEKFGEVATNINSAIDEPITAFELQQNYPNPFNPETMIKFSIPLEVKGERSKVKITVFDLLGREVALLVDGYKQAGTYEVFFDSSNLPSGVYFYRLTAGNYSKTKKMMLLK